MNFSSIPLRAWFATLSLGCFGLVAFGLALQDMLRLSPCPLCIFQRLLYLLIGGVALAGVMLPVASSLWSVVIVVLALLGVGVAGYQSWMQLFPDLASECSFTEPNLIERLVDWLGMPMPSLFLATGFCSSKEWVFLGLSMANWSVLIFAAIAVYAVLLLRRKA